jgi:hypothetical protein
MPSRRLEDKIRQLCALAMVANDEDAWLILSELRILLGQHIERFRIVAGGCFLGAEDFVELRKAL